MRYIGLEQRKDFQSRKRMFRRINKSQKINFRNICIEKFVRGKQNIKEAENKRSGSKNGSQKRLVAVR